MKNTTRFAQTTALVLSLFITPYIAAADATIYTVDDQSYDDVMFGLENAIIDSGLVISEHNHIAEMLERTKADVGATNTVFENADILGFCSAELSRKAMEADPMNIRFCPYQIFTFQEIADGPITIGFEQMPDGVMQEVEALLNTLTRAAIGLD